MISSTISTERSARPELIPASATARPRNPRPSPDQISTESAEFLRAELKRQPAVRPEVVARGRALAADPNYPSMETLGKVAEQILKSPDLSEDQS
jgi:hypothetical protein